MPKSINFVPRYCRHKASGQAVVTIAGKDHYLGPWQSQASRIEYDRLIGEWLAQGRPRFLPASPAELTVTELCASYWDFAKNYYVKNGEPTNELPGVQTALRVLRRYYGKTKAVAFGPLALKAVRERFIDEGHGRLYVNQNTGRIKRMFRWAASEELLPVAVYQALATVSGLRRGKTRAPDSEPVTPVAQEVVEATLPHLPRVVADMVRFQRFTGCRPTEVCILRPCDVDKSRKEWWYPVTEPRHVILGGKPTVVSEIFANFNSIRNEHAAFVPNLLARMWIQKEDERRTRRKKWQVLVPAMVPGNMV
jgi:integrase